MSLRHPVFTCLPLLAALGCSASNATSQNPFEEDPAGDDKFDTGWQSSLNSVEVELDLEGDVTADARHLERSPLEVGQFALTWLRKHENVFIQSLAEDFANGTDQIEWRLNGEWKKLADVPADARSFLTHFRMKGVSAIILDPKNKAEIPDHTYEATVPRDPAGLFAAVGKTCGTKEGSVDVEDGVYWYVWDPEKRGCKAETTTLTAKVAKVMPGGGTTFPEYDRLLEDKKIEALVLFGQVEHGDLEDSDLGFQLQEEFVAILERGGFKQAEAERGVRYTRTRRGVTAVVDIYGPREFSGLDDFAHVAAFDAGVRSHEIIVWNGHSMLGASDFWARPSIYSGEAQGKYQIFLYNGCLGYEYYVNPILEGKGGWGDVDIVSNVVETPFAIVVEETAVSLSRMFLAAERGGNASWQQILTRMNNIAAEESFYGVSGARTNDFHPAP